MFNRFTQLYEEFEPTGSDDAVPLPIGNYYYTTIGANYKSNKRKTFSYTINPTLGRFYNGDIFSVKASLNYRIQPHFSTSIQLNYNKINLLLSYFHKSNLKKNIFSHTKKFKCHAADSITHLA